MMMITITRLDASDAICVPSLFPVYPRQPTVPTLHLTISLPRLECANTHQRFSVKYLPSHIEATNYSNLISIALLISIAHRPTAPTVSQLCVPFRALFFRLSPPLRHFPSSPSDKAPTNIKL